MDNKCNTHTLGIVDKNLQSEAWKKMGSGSDLCQNNNIVYMTLQINKHHLHEPPLICSLFWNYKATAQYISK